MNAAKRKGKISQFIIKQDWQTYLKLISQEFQTSFEISQLDNDFGPAVLEKDVQALVVSDETASQGDVLNELRKQKDLPPVEVIVVPMHLAKDGKRISTSRIKNSEIDKEGNLLSIDKKLV